MRINGWMYDSYKAFYERSGRYPGPDDEDEVLESVFERIDAAGIWIPAGEVFKHYEGVSSNLRRRLNRERSGLLDPHQEAEVLPMTFSVCRLSYSPCIVSDSPFVFMMVTDRSIAMVCPADDVPADALECDEGWFAIRTVGSDPFNGAAAFRMQKHLTAEGIASFVVTAYDGACVFVRQEVLASAVKRLGQCGCIVRWEEMPLSAAPPS